MSEQILKVEADPRDQACIQITLRHSPRKFQFWRSATPQVVVYKGHGNNWYRLPSFKPAPSRLIPLLKAISYGPQFKHLRYRIYN
ncbi:hypothetical protein [Aliikangiella coralliicola]|uniref:Uncharacterized protein n=1 Tax=Aliikangiella coralliicola TaxID=2592383 RepID=A0A545UAN6_9GAMM|nr:hypothetical protein [Aliikangiella coralliicola]TQV86526.1 hypothetical protein FLL46_16595 [Aliikangiella coralliicola]